MIRRMTKIEKAKELINTFATGDADKVFLQTVYNFAEHWDVMETIADKESWQNTNGKF